MRPHRQQPTRLPRPWDSPDKNTGVGYHFLLQCMKVKSERSRSVVSDSLQPHGPQPTGSSVHRSVETLELLYIAAGYVKNHTGAVENSLAVTCFEHSYYMIQKINP